MKVKLIPTILTPSLVEFKERLEGVAPFFNLAQIDCEDGKFVKNKTFYNKSVICNLKSEICYELHLMIMEPLKEIKRWVGFKKVKRIIFHYEAVKNDKEITGIIDYLHQKGIKAGLAINPQTGVEKILKFLPLLDLLLVMGVNPGWGGQEIELKTVKLKVHTVRKLFPKLDIEVDGGVNIKNFASIVKAGANLLAMGKALSSAEDIKKFKENI